MGESGLKASYTDKHRTVLMLGTTVPGASYLNDCMNPVKHCADIGVHTRAIIAGTAHTPTHHTNQLPVGRQIDQRTSAITLGNNRMELEGWNLASVTEESPNEEPYLARIHPTIHVPSAKHSGSDRGAVDGGSCAGLLVNQRNCGLLQDRGQLAYQDKGEGTI